MAKEKRVFWVIDDASDLDDDAAVSAWPERRRKHPGFDAYSVARELCRDALSGGDDGDEVTVIVAGEKDGSDATRYKMTISVEVSYDMDEKGRVNLSPLPIDETTGNVVKGLQDDATLPLF